ncbi:hypothetical protein F9K85_14290 [Brucella tritici]|uniref:Uncharacterized protein n=1 Tax=Brucella tritici TaxID=94626 RepID=A0A6N6QJA8_9HYPH|nr:hypothetical protein [Brucella tritici]KAB2675542.1 hypothetical protein F9K85_14290 [Brucella tritici]KAB2684278.1 hypothetical protein F9L08_14795 [Brucella tritici]
MIMEQNQSAPALELGQSSKTSKFVLGRGFLLSSFIASLSFAASVLVPSVSYANGPQIIFQENGWIAFPKQKDPEKGCVMGRHIKNNVHAIIYVNNNETFQIGLTSADWRLEQGTEWNGAIAFDSDRSITTTVRASFKNTVVVPSGAGEDSLENRIRTAARVRISFNNETYDVSLKGSSNALDMLWSCAEGGMGASSFSLPIQSGFYAIVEGNCSGGLGPNVIYTDSKSLNWPSSACRFENVEKINQSQYRVKQTCGRNLDDVETTEDIYTIQSATRFSFKYGDQLTALNRCNPKTLPQAAGVTSPFYALPTTEEIAEYARSKIEADDENGPHSTETANSTPNLSAIDCLIAVGGETYADGACQWRADKSGSFSVYSGKYSAAVNVDHVSTVHSGYWNAGKGSYSQPDIAIGYMQQDGACWKSTTATICAWKIGERQRGGDQQFPGESVVQKSMTGRIVVGSTDSAFEITGSDGGNSYGFLTQSNVGQEIFKICQMDNECRIEGNFNEERKWIEAVSHVEKMPSAPGSVQSEQTLPQNTDPGAFIVNSPTGQSVLDEQQQMQLKKDSPLMYYMFGIVNYGPGKPVQLDHDDIAVVKSQVGQQLRDETSARFRDDIAAARIFDGSYSVCGSVNGKNQFGAYSGYAPFWGIYNEQKKSFDFVIIGNTAVRMCQETGVTKATNIPF